MIMNIKEVEFEGQLPIELTNMIVTPNQLIGLDEKDIKHVVNGGKGKAFIFEQEEEDYPTFMKNSFNTLGEKNEVKGGKSPEHPNHRKHTKHGGHELCKRLHGQPR